MYCRHRSVVVKLTQQPPRHDTHRHQIISLHYITSDVVDDPKSSCYNTCSNLSTRCELYWVAFLCRRIKPRDRSFVWVAKGRRFHNSEKVEMAVREYLRMQIFTNSRTRMEISSILVLLESCLQTCMTYTIAECTVNKLPMMDR